MFDPGSFRSCFAFMVFALVSTSSTALPAHHNLTPEDKISGELRYAENSNADSKAPKFVVVDNDKKWHLSIIDSELNNRLKRSIGYMATVNGSVSNRKSNNGTTRQVIRVEGITVRPMKTGDNAKWLEKRKAKGLERYQASQKPLSKKEVSEALAEFGMDSAILDLDLKLKHVLTMSQYRSGQTKWVIQPSGAFEKFRVIPNFGGTDPMTSVGSGKMSQRQIVGFARRMSQQKLLELPEQIGTEIDTDKLSEKTGAEVVVVEFGDFKSVGHRANTKSKETKAVQDQQRRLTAFMYQGTMELTGNLQYQNAKKKEPK